MRQKMLKKNLPPNSPIRRKLPEDENKKSRKQGTKQMRSEWRARNEDEMGSQDESETREQPPQLSRRDVTRAKWTQ